MNLLTWNRIILPAGYLQEITVFNIDNNIYEDTYKILFNIHYSMPHTHAEFIKIDYKVKIRNKILYCQDLSGLIYIPSITIRINPRFA